MALRFAVLTCSDTEWNQLLSAFPEATVFHTAAWLRLLERHEKTKWKKLGIYRGQQLVGICPLQIRQKGIFKLAMSPLNSWSTPYLGPLVDEAYRGRLPTKLAHFLRKLGYDYTEFILWGTEAQEALTNAGFVCETRYTYVNDLTQGAQKLWQGLRCRTGVRKAMRNGLSVEVVSDPSLLDLYYQMALDTYKEKERSNPYTLAMLRDVWATLVPKGKMRLWAVVHEGRPIAFEIVFYFRGQVFFWDAVAWRDDLRLRPANLSIWSVMEHAAQAGYQASDLVGGTDHPGIAQFKKSFGGNLVPYTYAKFAFNPLAGAAHYIRQRYVPLLRQARQLRVSIRGEREPQGT